MANPPPYTRLQPSQPSQPNILGAYKTNIVIGWTSLVSIVIFLWCFWQSNEYNQVNLILISASWGFFFCSVLFFLPYLGGPHSNETQYDMVSFTLLVIFFGSLGILVISWFAWINEQIIQAYVNVINAFGTAGLVYTFIVLSVLNCPQR